MNDDDIVFTTREAAEYAHVGLPAIYKALYQGQIKATQQKDKAWLIKKSDLDHYRANRYNFSKRKMDGKPLFDADKGFYSVPEVAATLAHLTRTPYAPQRLYYLIRIGRLPAIRKGKVYIIKREDAIGLVESEKEWNMRHLKEA
jgi:excisionase family DNA binding protein